MKKAPYPRPARRTCLAWIALAFASVCASALAQDYAREKRWAREVVPDLVVGDAAWLMQANGHRFLGLYTRADKPKGAVLMVHGLGVQPNFGFFAPLRAGLADAGYSTLSIQMPVLAAGATAADYFPQLFPDAIERIALGERWLAARDYARIVLLSHSLGSRMSEAYFARTPAAPFVAWVCLGHSGGFDALKNLALPVLDVYGEHDLSAVMQAAARRRAVLERIPGSSQVVIAGADHFYDGREAELQSVIAGFLARVLATAAPQARVHPGS